MAASEQVDYTVVVPAYNEERLLPDMLETLGRAMEAVTNARGEVVVVDNNSVDATAAVALAAGARVVHEPINQISRARNAGAGAATGRFLVFVDADTHISATLLQAAIDELASGRTCGGGTAVGTSENVPPWARRALNGWNWLARRRGWAAGCFVYCTQEAFQAIGGFSLDVFAGEEILFSRALRRWGRSRGQSVRILEIPVDTSMRKVHWFGPLHLVLFSLKTCLWPLRLRSRKACGIWYDRPDASR